MSEPVTTRRRGEALEAAICGAALAELTESGYSSVTIDGVANRARTGKASIYRRWPGKAELVADAVCRAMPHPDAGAYAAELPDSVGTRDALLMMVENMVVNLDAEAIDSLRCIISEVVRDPNLATMLEAAVICPRQRTLAALAERGIRLGDVRSDAPVEMIAEIMPGILMKRMLLRAEPVMDRELGARIVDDLIMPLLAPHPIGADGPDRATALADASAAS